MQRDCFLHEKLHVVIDTTAWLRNTPVDNLFAWIYSTAAENATSPKSSISEPVMVEVRKRVDLKRFDV